MPTYELTNVNKLVFTRFVIPYFLSMNPFFDELNVDHILHFIRSYRRLEQMPLEDGFAELACVAKSNQPAEEKRLRQHFRNHWYSKERAFGRFYLNLPHYRQLYLLHQWDLVHYEDATYLWECERDGRFALMAQAPPLARQLHALVLFFENHGINRQLTASIELEKVPTEFDQRFGNSANWGEYILSLDQPGGLLSELLRHGN